VDWIIDSDAHVTEDPGIWVDRLPAKWLDLAPRMMQDPDTGEDQWYVGGEKTGATVGTSAVGAGTWTFPDRPRTMAECEPATYRASARLDYMDSLGIWAQVIYPNVGGFGNARFLNLPDPEMRLACVRAYNDWLIEWCSEDARRLLGVCALPFWDVAACVTEVERCADLGHRAILFTGEPQRFTGRYFCDPYWDPLWAVASETGLPISFHLGSGNMERHLEGDRFLAYGKRATSARASVSLFLDNGQQVVDFLLSGVLPRFPELRAVSVESGAGWVPFVLQMTDLAFEDYSMGLDYPCYEMRPSDYFHRSMAVCYFTDRLTPETVATIGEDNLLFETDFPHVVGLAGEEVRPMLERGLAGNSEAVRRKITFDNAARLYHVGRPAS
jgi:predicted TIM-barrel fold metal-dependent hydrolase